MGNVRCATETAWVGRDGIRAEGIDAKSDPTPAKTAKPALTPSTPLPLWPSIGKSSDAMSRWKRLKISRGA